MYTINDLPRFSPWPARLIGIEPWQQRYKTPQEVSREYEKEKWGPLLDKVREVKYNVKVEDVDKWVFEGMRASLCSIGSHLELLTPFDAHQQYLKLIKHTLKPYVKAPALVELGAGYGSIILSLSQHPDFSETLILAGEYTNSGMELIKYLANSQNSAVKVGHCDFSSNQIFDFSIPEHAVIFTSYATPYVSIIPAEFVKSLCMCEPRVIIHFEPCYEHCDPNTLTGLMRRRYIELNDYNTNLVTLLHDQQRQGNIKIIEERPSVFGPNPLLAVSVLIWKPTGQINS